MTSSTSNYLQAVSQAKSAILFEDSLESSDDHFSSVDKLEISNDLQQSSLTEDQGLHPVRLVKEILDNQEILSKHRGNEEDKLQETWSYKLGSPEVVTKLVDISDRLSNIIERKETLLETLRNPIAENSIPWKKEKQIDLVQTINYLKQLSDNKETDKSNASWIENQNWEQFTDKELPAVETKILKLEADIAQEVKECKVIKSLTE